MGFEKGGEIVSYPKTKDEWWQSVNDNWKNLKNIVLTYYPNQDKFPEGGYKTGKPFLEGPQTACNHVIKEIQAEGGALSRVSLSEYIEDLKEKRDSRLDNIFQSSWFGMPETSSIRQISGFHIFCDLCSENYVLYEVKK